MYKTLYDNGYIDASTSLGARCDSGYQEFVDGKYYDVTVLSMLKQFRLRAPLIFERRISRFLVRMVSMQKYVRVLACHLYKSKYVDGCRELLDTWYNSSDIWKAMVATGKSIMTYGDGSEIIIRCSTIY